MKDVNNVPVIDLFRSIQGEGTFMGVPSIFIRVSGCNLRCVFKNSICDTAYSSHNPEKGKFSLAEIQQFIKINPQIEHIVLTGGEPCLYPEMITWLTENYPEHVLTVETNGTIYPGPVANRVDLFSVSPKLSSSTPTEEKLRWQGIKGLDGWAERHENTRQNIQVLKNLIIAANTQFKYVISSSWELEEAKNQIHQVEKETGIELGNNGVFLMPEGDTEEKLQENRKRVAELCIENGYNYSERLQFVIWGSEREA